jgi:hypothetical protein
MLILSCWFAKAADGVKNRLQFLKFETCATGTEVVEKWYLHKAPLPMFLSPKCHV